MPSVSKKQFKFMKAVESGSIKAPGLSRSEAKEYTEDTDYKSLPETSKFSKIKKALGR